MTNAFLTETPLLDLSHPTIVSLLDAKQWGTLPEFERIGAVYDFVREEIAFGYNRRDDIPASTVLADAYGQCNTKATLLMALLRAVGIPCRLHGFTIDKSLQRGVVPELVYPLAPRDILHSWVEVFYDNRWINLEGFILDSKVLQALQRHFSGEGSLCGYGAGTHCLQNPQVLWQGSDTYIQETGINQDFGLFDTPDQFFASHGQSFGFVRGLMYEYFIRHWMNARVRKMRAGHVPEIPGGPDQAPARDFSLTVQN